MMKKCYFSLAMVIILCSITRPTNGGYHSKTTIENPKPLKKTTLHFYLRDILSGLNPTVSLVAKPNITMAMGQNSGTNFGSVYAMDDVLTEGPEADSKVIGNAQGLYVFSSQGVPSLVLYMDFGFTTGEFNGSSISVFSRDPITEGLGRELAVVGGRKKFRMAKGFIIVNTYSFDMKTGDAVLEYFVTLYH